MLAGPEDKYSIGELNLSPGRRAPYFRLSQPATQGEKSASTPTPLAEKDDRKPTPCWGDFDLTPVTRFLPLHPSPAAFLESPSPGRNESATSPSSGPPATPRRFPPVIPSHPSVQSRASPGASTRPRRVTAKRNRSALDPTAAKEPGPALTHVTPTSRPPGPM